MNKNFILFDKNNNLEKNANMIVKFMHDEKEYLIYSIQENEQNSQIFVSKLILNSEGNYYIDGILNEEKNKLSNIVYNIVILLPSDVEKGNAFQSLINNLFDKFSVKLLKGLPNMGIQEYYSNCSIAVTNNILVDNAVKIYDENLNIEVEKEVIEEIPMWTAPIEATLPTPVENDISINNVDSIVISDPISVQGKLDESTLNSEDIGNIENVLPVLESDNIIIPGVSNTSSVSNENVLQEVLPSDDEVIIDNPQTQKIAIMSDPSLGISVNQPNVMDNKKAGFANTKYVVIGTICLVLAIAVIITAYILIRNIG